jgi:hypothetical protein
MNLMNISIEAGSPTAPEVQALTALLRSEIPGVNVMYRMKTRDSGAVHHVLQFISQHETGAAIYVAGAVTKKVIDVVADWANATWFKKTPRGGSVVIYGPDGQPVKTIERDEKIT